MGADDNSFLYTGAGLGVFFLRQRNCQCVAGHKRSRLLCFQLLGIGVRYGSLQISPCLCDYQNFHGVVSVTPDACGADERSIGIPGMEKCAAPPLHSGLLLGGNADFHGHSGRLRHVLHHNGGLFLPHTAIHHLQRHLLLTGAF